MCNVTEPGSGLGSDQVTSWVPCPEGYFCDEESAIEHLECAAGVAVQAEREAIAQNMTSASDPLCPCLDTCGSTPWEDNRTCYCPIGLCPAGYICYEGTPASTKFGNPCPEGYYCPEGTSPKMLPAQMCPEHTSSAPRAASLWECVRTSPAVVSNVTSGALFGASNWAALDGDSSGFFVLNGSRATITISINATAAGALAVRDHWRLSVYDQSSQALELSESSPWQPAQGIFTFTLQSARLPLSVRPVLEILHGLFAGENALFVGAASLSYDPVAPPPPPKQANLTFVVAMLWPLWGIFGVALTFAIYSKWKAMRAARAGIEGAIQKV